MKIPRRVRRSLGYGVYGFGDYGQNPFQPNFTVCKFEGGTANCPSEYVKEFSGSRLSDFIPEFQGISDIMGDNPIVGVVAGIGVAIALECILRRPLLEMVTLGKMKVSRHRRK